MAIQSTIQTKNTHPHREGLRGSLSKQELALLYNPKCSPRSAVGTLRRWIARCAPLRKELLKTGYSKKQHILSVQQVKLIMEYLGEP